MYELLDAFFFVFHATIIVFSLFGWIWPKMRRTNLILLALIGGSWFVLGIWHGIGYCPCTDWHWQIRNKLGYRDMPNSYVKFLVDSVTGLNVSARLIDVVTLVFFTLALAASIYMNIRDRRVSKVQ